MATEFADGPADAELADRRIFAFAIGSQKRLFANMGVSLARIGSCS